MSLLEARQVGRRFDARWVLKDVDLSNIEPIRELDEECLHELDEFKLILESFKPEIQPLIGFEELLNKFKAGLNHKTSFERDPRERQPVRR